MIGRLLSLLFGPVLGRGDRRHALERPVDGVLDGWRRLEERGLPPAEMHLGLVLTDVARSGGATRLEKVSFCFTGGSDRDVVCQLDNEVLSLVRSEPFPSPSRPEEWAPLDLADVRVDLAEAIAVADARVGAAVADREPPDLLVDALLKTRDGRPTWEISYDVWLEEGPESTDLVRVDASSGKVIGPTAGGAPGDGGGGGP